MSKITINNNSEPDSPTTDRTVLWADSIEKVLKSKDDAGNVYAYGDTKKILISATDTTEGYGEDKLVAGDNMSVTVLNPGGNEQIEIAANLTNVPDTVVEITGGINAPTHIDSQKEWNNHFTSSTIVDGAEYTKEIDGTLSLTECQAVIRVAADSHVDILPVKVAATSSIALANNAANYVYIDYNAGAPVWVVSTSEGAYNSYDKVLGFIVARRDNILKVVDARFPTVDFGNVANQLFKDFGRFLHKSGGTAIGSSGLAITVTAGRFWYGTNPIPHPAFDTSIAGTANENIYTSIYGSFTITDEVKLLDNVNYDNGGTLTAMANGRWKSDFLYMVNNDPSSLALVYGKAQYTTQVGAEGEALPALPPALEGVGVLVGRYLIQEGIGTVIAQSYFDEEFSATGITEHNGLSGIDGGTIDEYYHMTLAQHTNLTSQDASLTTTGTPTFNSVTANNSPTVASDLVRKDYVDGLIQNVKRKENCLTATTENITLSGEQVIDTIVTSSSRVLVWQQTSPTQNGIYLTSAGAWARTDDANTGLEIIGALTKVLQGATYGDHQFNNSNSTVPTLGADNITFVNLGGGVVHSQTLGLQGGTTDEYYHMTNTEHTAATSIATQTQNGLMSTGVQNFAGDKAFFSKLQMKGGTIAAPIIKFWGDGATGWSNTAAGTISHSSAGTEVFKTNSTGADIPNGHLKIAGTQVLTTQQAAVADATGTATGSNATVITDLQTQLNLALAALRAHGIIAT